MTKVAQQLGYDLSEEDSVKVYEAFLTIAQKKEQVSSKELDAKFVKEAEAAGFVNLKGHRSVGGMRASIYNAMPIEGVKALVDFMDRFCKDNR